MIQYFMGKSFSKALAMLSVFPDEKEPKNQDGVPILRFLKFTGAKKRSPPAPGPNNPDLK